MKVETFVVGPLLTNCYFLSLEKETVVIDPGFLTQEILEKAKQQKISYIILTHHHWDHILGAQELKKITKAKILIHEEDGKFLKFEADKFLKGGEKLKIGKETLEIIHTPGHTPGSICILANNFLFTGDTLFEDGVGRTDLPGGSAKDLQKSLKILEKIIRPEIKIFPGHGPSFSRER